MAQRLLALPEPYDGTGSWPEWVANDFENVAVINSWESAEDKLKRLTGRAQTTFLRFPEAVRKNTARA